MIFYKSIQMVGAQMKTTIRILLALWGLFFSVIAVRGIIQPSTFEQTFNINASGTGINSLRADFGSFFLIAGIGAFWGAIHPEQPRALWVPAGLLGVAFVIRAIGLLLNDPIAPSITQAMMVEAISVLFLLGSAAYLARATRKIETDKA
jgi:hypothetical protein